MLTNSVDSDNSDASPTTLSRQSSSPENQTPFLEQDQVIFFILTKSNIVKSLILLDFEALLED